MVCGCSPDGIGGALQVPVDSCLLALLARACIPP